MALWRQNREQRSLRNAAFLKTQWGFVLAGGRQMANGTFEPAETTFIAKALDHADAFLDIGANVGLYACLARSRGKSVVAIEPHPDNLAYLLNNLAANGWTDVEVFPVGLLSRAGIAPLFGASTGASTVESWAGISTAWKQYVPVTTLDHLVSARFVGQRMLIKVDVEGAEYEVLEGAHATLRRTPRPVWLIEINFSEHFPTGRNPNYERVFQAFWSAGYTATAVSNGELVTPGDVSDWMRTGERRIDETNFIFR